MCLEPWPSVRLRKFTDVVFVFVFGTITKSPLKRDICLRKVNNVEFVSGIMTKCPFNRGVRVRKVKKEVFVCV